MNTKSLILAIGLAITSPAIHSLLYIAAIESEADFPVVLYKGSKEIVWVSSKEKSVFQDPSYLVIGEKIGGVRFHPYQVPLKDWQFNPEKLRDAITNQNTALLTKLSINLLGKVTISEMSEEEHQRKIRLYKNEESKENPIR